MTLIRMPHIFNLSSLVTLALLATVTSCSDDDFSLSSKGRRISFDVTIMKDWSRAGEDATSDGGSLSTVILKEGEKPLYLIPEVVHGIESASGTDHASRGRTITKLDIADFGVYASTRNDAGGYYMDNVEVTKDNAWAPAQEYLWPGNGTLHINAYSPYCATPDAASGITALPVSDVTVTPTIDYVVPTTVTSQVDLMWATPRDASSSPCPMEFNHALSAIKFVAGSEMEPCTVKSIVIAGLKGNGTLNLETGEWSDLAGDESYTATLNAALIAPSGNQYVEQGSTITDDDNTFLLLPQTLTEGATITMTIDYNGEEMQFTASLDGQSWSPGNTYIYHLSANPTLDRFVITVASPLAFNYTGGSKDFEVKSVHEHLKNGVLTTDQVPWVGEFVDGAGNVIETPAWITDMTMAGNGSINCSASTQMVEPTFVQMSQPTQILRQQAEVGSASNPYNLANSTGASTVENTANCYIVNAPGTYSIPLVYGNAIKNGSDNSAAYASNRSSAPFVNSLGNRIKEPYIYDTQGVVPGGAKLVWEGRLNMIHNLHLSADGRSLVFEIPRAYIRQGNAVVAVTDASGNILWSWQLWITDYKLGNDLSTLTYNGKNFEMMPYNLGNVEGGDIADFASSSVLLRFTQKPVDGSEGKSVTIEVKQTGKHIITPDCYSFYQWGRKDPMISGIKEWYYDDHTEITQIDTRPVPATSDKVDTDFDAQCVKYPQVFWVASTGQTFHYTNNWNVGTSTTPVKTVYDPSPVGFMVPGNEIMALRDLPTSKFGYITSSGISKPAGFSVVPTAGPNLFFPALGYRSGSSGAETVTDASGGELAAVWASHANTHEGSALILTNSTGSISHLLRTDPRLEAFAVRSIRE